MSKCVVCENLQTPVKEKGWHCLFIVNLWACACSGQRQTLQVGRHSWNELRESWLGVKVNYSRTLCADTLTTTHIESFTKKSGRGSSSGAASACKAYISIIFFCCCCRSCFSLIKKKSLCFQDEVLLQSGLKSCCPHPSLMGLFPSARGPYISLKIERGKIDDGECHAVDSCTMQYVLYEWMDIKWGKKRISLFPLWAATISCRYRKCKDAVHIL